MESRKEFLFYGIRFELLLGKMLNQYLKKKKT